MPLTSAYLSDLVSLIEPFCRIERERLILIDTVFVGNEANKPDIDTSGASGEFTHRLILRLYNYGEITPGQPALAMLLDVIRKSVGLGKQAQIDRLKQEIFTPQPDPAVSQLETTPPAVKTASPPPSEPTPPSRKDSTLPHWRRIVNAVIGPTGLGILAILAGLLGAGCGNFVCQLSGASQGICGYCQTSSPTPTPKDEASVTPSPAASDTAVALVSTLTFTPSPLASLMVNIPTIQPSPTMLTLSATFSKTLMPSATSVLTPTPDTSPVTTTSVGNTINAQLDREGLPEVAAESALMTLAQAYAENIGQLPQDSLKERTNRGTLTLFNGEIELEAKARQFGYDESVSIIIIPQQNEITLSDLEARFMTDVSLKESGYWAYGFYLYESPLTQDQTAVLILGS